MMFVQDPTFWTLVAMVVLVFFFSTKGRPAMAMIRQAIDDQISEIRRQINQAQHDLAAAKMSLNRTQEQWTTVVLTANEIRANAESEARSLTEDARRTLDRLIRSRHMACQERIRHEEERALRDIRAVVAARIVDRLKQKILSQPSTGLEDLKTVSDSFCAHESSKKSDDVEQMAFDGAWQ